MTTFFLTLGSAGSTRSSSICSFFSKSSGNSFCANFICSASVLLLMSLMIVCTFLMSCCLFSLGYSAIIFPMTDPRFAFPSYFMALSRVCFLMAVSSLVIL